ncbi:hypothetical protein [Geodermatophilus tzadiensis]|uniref:hypothetical protein n=1 Tax=Geodermatophilus tzadiensis TaxID=1137988 RepID=UPI001FE6EB6A|nr:hypothetical protein [Geodermatophilus tzadiensis]
MRSRLLLAVLASLAVGLLAGGTAWALLGGSGEGNGAGQTTVPAPIDIPARDTPAAPSVDDGTPAEPPDLTPAPDPVPAPTPAPAPAPQPTDVVPPPPLPDDDDDDDDGAGDTDDGDD